MSTGSSTPETSAPTNILADLEQYLDAYRSAIEAECNAGPDYADTDPDVDRAYERVNVLGTELRRRMGEHQRLAEPPHLSEPAEAPLDCRSEPGETVGLIDAAITALRTTRRGPRDCAAMYAAIADLHADREIATLLASSPVLSEPTEAPERRMERLAAESMQRALAAIREQNERDGVNNGRYYLCERCHEVAEMSIAAGEFICSKCGAPCVLYERSPVLLERGDEPADAMNVMQDDIAEMLRALGLSDHARSVSPHRVVQDEVLPAIRALTARVTQLESDRRALAILASERPEFFNPQALTAAKALRDDILAGVPR